MVMKSFRGQSDMFFDSNCLRSSQRDLSWLPIRIPENVSDDAWTINIERKA